MVLVSYDVSTESAGGKRRACAGSPGPASTGGQRVQFSVFECEVDPAQWAALKARLMKEIDPETDSLRFYFLGANWQPAGRACRRQAHARFGRPAGHLNVGGEPGASGRSPGGSPQTESAIVSSS